MFTIEGDILCKKKGIVESKRGSKMRCPKCGGCSFDSQGICLYCGNNMQPSQPRRDAGLGKVDIFKLAEGLAEKEKGGTPLTEKRENKLEICPECLEQSLWYNQRDKKYECMNKKCPSNN